MAEEWFSVSGATRSLNEIYGLATTIHGLTTDQADQLSMVLVQGRFVSSVAGIDQWYINQTLNQPRPTGAAVRRPLFIAAVDERYVAAVPLNSCLSQERWTAVLASRPIDLPFRSEMETQTFYTAVAVKPGGEAIIINYTGSLGESAVQRYLQNRGYGRWGLLNAGSTVDGLEINSRYPAGRGTRFGQLPLASFGKTFMLIFDQPLLQAKTFSRVVAQQPVEVTLIAIDPRQWHLDIRYTPDAQLLESFMSDPLALIFPDGQFANVKLRTNATGVPILPLQAESYRRPAGLRIDNGFLRNPLNPQDPVADGVFLLKVNGNPSIKSTGEFDLDLVHDVRMAFQAGPILVRGGLVVADLERFRTGKRPRAVLGLTKAGEIRYIRIKQEISLTDLAAIVADVGMTIAIQLQGDSGAVYAMNGQSSRASNRAIPQFDEMVVVAPNITIPPTILRR